MGYLEVGRLELFRHVIGVWVHHIEVNTVMHCQLSLVTTKFYNHYYPAARHDRLIIP